MKQRLWYLLLVILVIPTGLLIRKYDHILGGIGAHAPDALWALMIYLGWGVINPRWKPWKKLVMTLVLAFGIEFSQLYHAPWIDRIRQTFMGSMILGHGFLWVDLVRYSVGAGVGWVVERMKNK